MLQMEQQNEDERNWRELNEDILIVIFKMVGTIDVLKSAGYVCRVWRKVAKDEPDLWRRIDMTDHDYGYDDLILRKMKKLAKIAIDRSGGRLEDFWIKSLGSNYLLRYLCDRTSVLKSLRLISCHNISVENVVEAVKRQPLLEELDISFRIYSPKLPELVGKQLPNLKQFSWWPRCILDLNPPGDNEEAFGIAKNMHELRFLQLLYNWMTNEGLKAILEGCPHLETLDIRGCFNVKMDSDMRAWCARLTTLKLP